MCIEISRPDALSQELTVKGGGGLLAAAAAASAYPGLSSLRDVPGEMSWVILRPPDRSVNPSNKAAYLHRQAMLN